MKRQKFFLIMVVIVVSIFLRFYYFWRPSFSSDEAHYVLKAIQILHGIKDFFLTKNFSVVNKNLFLPFLEHAHGPLEFMVIIPFVVFQPREFFARLPFVLISCVSLVAGFYCLKKLRNYQVAFIFTALLGTSRYVIWWSQTAMYQTLSISASLIIVIMLLRFLKKSSGRSLMLLSAGLGFGVLVFPDFLLFLPGIAWAVYDRRRFFFKKDIFAAGVLFFLIAGIYYIPWIGYSLINPQKEVGFNLLWGHKLSTVVNPVDNLRGFWGNFFGYPGIFPTWIFSLLSIFLIKKITYIKYLLLTIAICFFVYVFKAYLPYFYFVSTAALLILLAAESLVALKKIGWFIFFATLLFQFVSLSPLLSGVPNRFVFIGGQPNDQIQKVGAVAKKCITKDNETFISTTDAGRQTYYFGRISNLYRDGTAARILTIESFLGGGLLEVKLIHVREGEIPRTMSEKLRQKAIKIIKYQDDLVYLFKKCL